MNEHNKTTAHKAVGRPTGAPLKKRGWLSQTPPLNLPPFDVRRFISERDVSDSYRMLMRAGDAILFSFLLFQVADASALSMLGICSAPKLLL
ncbi:MAG: hypothetical protein WCX65_18775, partial [bacterium]